MNVLINKCSDINLRMFKILLGAQALGIEKKFEYHSNTFNTHGGIAPFFDNNKGQVCFRKARLSIIQNTPDL